MDDKNPIFRSLAMIEERLQEKLTVEILAESAHFSKYHYQRIFREAVGDTVMGYVTRRRLMLAAGALAETADSVLDIALKYGYDSHEGFTRSFKAYLGITPTEYRKYHSAIGFPGEKKEERTMMDSKNKEEMIRELNSLIVQAKETAEAARKQGAAGRDAAEAARKQKGAGETAEIIETRKVVERNTAEITGAKMTGREVEITGQQSIAVKDVAKEAGKQKTTEGDTRETVGKQKEATGAGTAVYVQVWEFASARAEKMAEELSGILSRVTVVEQRPDEISARFLLIKAVEDAAFEASVTAFQVGLMIARALPEHRAAFQPMCRMFDSLAQNARIKSGKIAGFINELSALLFEDMRKNAQQRIQGAVEAGMAAAGRLSDPSLPYGYIADGVREIAEELESRALEDVTVYFLEDAVFRMETVLFAADMDLLRAPQHRQLFDGILDFWKKLGETAEFFRNLSGDAFAGGERTPGGNRTKQKLYSDLAAQEGILLFYLKGEIQKLGAAHLDEGQKSALDAVCGKMDRAVKLARNTVHGEEGGEIAQLLHEAYEELKAEAERLGMYGGAIGYLAEEMNKPLKYLPE